MLLVSLGAIIGGICGLIVLFVRKKHGFSVKNLYLPLFLIVWGSVWFYTETEDLRCSRYQMNHLMSVYANKNYKISEGIVHVLHEQPSVGHDKGDVIKVGAQTFIINYFTRTLAYHQTIAYGGVLKEEINAKIYHYGEQILRIDIHNSDLPKINEDDTAKHERAVEKQFQLDIIWADCIWASGIVIVNILYYMRKTVLLRYNCKTGFFDFWFEDRGKLKAIIKDETSLVRRRIFKSINAGIPLLFILSVAIMVLIRILLGMQ